MPCRQMLRCSGAVPRPRSRRASLRRWHRLIALVVGGLFAFSGLTGALLVQHRAMDSVLNPALLTTSCASPEVTSLQVLMDAALSPGMPDARVTRIDLPIAPGAPARVHRADDRDAAITEVYVAPCSGRVLGEREMGQGLVAWLYRAHHTLLLGDFGEGLLVTAAVLLVVAVVTGVVMWWPRGGGWIRALRVRRARPRHVQIFDLHRVVGAISALGIVVIAGSGAGMVIQGGVTNWFQAQGWVRATPTGPDTAGAAPVLGPDAVAQRVLQAVPGVLRRVYLPGPGRPMYRLVVRQPGDHRYTTGSSIVWVDGATGRLLDSRTLANLRPAERLLTWLYPLHNGEAFGSPGRGVVMAVGLILPILYGTGVWLWWRRRVPRPPGRARR